MEEALPERIRKILVRDIQVKHLGNNNVQVNADLAAAKITNLFNDEMIDFLRIISAAGELPPEEFKAHIMGNVEKAEELLSQMKVEL
jgi:hypothetical protein